MINLVNELQKAYNGNAWHGNSVLKLISSANPAKVFTHPVPNAHSIAELVLHLTAWTEEVIDRINGIAAKEPIRGDWAAPIEMSEIEWTKIVLDFKEANEQLVTLSNNFIPDDWARNVKDERPIQEKEVINNAQLLNGLIQHHAYHSGQIALLLKF